MCPLTAIIATTLASCASGHGQLTVPAVRPDPNGHTESSIQREPVFTLNGPVFGHSSTGMRCHDHAPSSTAPQTELTAGAAFDATWTMEAGHPGDCYFYISYDADVQDPVNFFKVAAIPGCGAPDGLNIPVVVTQSVVLPAELPSCKHCVLRWEWTGHQQVVNIEFYVQCADVAIVSSAPPTKPSPMTAIAGIEHLPAAASDYRQVYTGEGPEEQFLVGPAVATYSACSPGSADCIGNGGDNGVPTLAPVLSPAPTSPVASPNPAPATGASCECSQSTGWDGDLRAFAADSQSFCSQNFGGSGPYISAGGGSGSSGGFSGAGPCTTGQYSFSEETGWRIHVSKEDAQGVIPYRAFAYAQFCNGLPYSACWTGDQVSFSFSFRASGISGVGAFVKLLFWTDGGNILGLLPPSHPKGNGLLRLVTFMQDDYPNTWSHEVEIEDDVRYHLRIDFTPSTQGVGVTLNGLNVGEGSIPVDMLASSSGPQIGVYSFDFGQVWPQDGFELFLNDACIGDASGTCPSGGGIPSTPVPSPVQVQAPSVAPTGALSPGVSPTPSPPSPATCPLAGNGLPLHVSECYCDFISNSDADGCGPDDASACWCECCCRIRGGTCRYKMPEGLETSAAPNVRLGGLNPTFLLVAIASCRTLLAVSLPHAAGPL